VYKGISLFLFGCLFLFPGISSLAAQTGELYFGTSKVDITPNESVALAGYPNPLMRNSTGIHDNLYCRVAAFKMNDQRLVLVSCDLIGFGSSTYEIYKNALTEKFGLKAAEIFIVGTHNHSGPILTLAEDYKNTSNYRYTQNLKNLIVKSVEIALNSLEPVQIGVDRGYSSIGVNRRVLKLAPFEFPDDGGLVKLGRNPKGIVDHEVLVMKITNKNNQSKGCLYDYACHDRSQDARNRIITGDFFGLSEQFIEKIIGNEVVASAFAGAAGDVDPLYIQSGFHTEPGWVPETELMGILLGEEVVNVFRGINDTVQVNDLKRELCTIKLPAKNEKEYITNYNIPSRSLNITVASIGEIAFIGLGCEAFTEIGLKIKEASPFKYNFIITLCNGSSGYLPPKELYKERGYGVSNSPFGPEAADAVIKQTLNMLYKQYSQEKL
jgi:neutral ceramidase